MNDRSLLLRPLAALFAVMWVGGVGHYILYGGPPPNAAWTAPAFLALGALMCLTAVERRHGVALAAAGALGWSAEAFGVRTGIPFGRYHYTDALGAGLLGVPIAMSAAWMLLVAHVVHLLEVARVGRFGRIPIAAAWLVLVDLVVDPVASGPLGFWRWDTAGAYFGVPIGNFAGWFAVGAVVVAAAGRPARPSGWVLAVGVGVIAFFAVLALSMGIVAPGVLGLALCGSHFMLLRSRGGAAS